MDNVEKLVWTPDEWHLAGLDYGVMAKSADELSESETWLERALYCFDRWEIILLQAEHTHQSSIHFWQNLSQFNSAYMDTILAERLFSGARNLLCHLAIVGKENSRYSSDLSNFKATFSTQVVVSLDYWR